MGGPRAEVTTIAPPAEPPPTYAGEETRRAAPGAPPGDAKERRGACCGCGAAPRCGRTARPLLSRACRGCCSCCAKWPMSNAASGAPAGSIAAELEAELAQVQHTGGSVSMELLRESGGSVVVSSSASASRQLGTPSMSTSALFARKIAPRSAEPGTRPPPWRRTKPLRRCCNPSARRCASPPLSALAGSTRGRRNAASPSSPATTSPGSSAGAAAGACGGAPPPAGCPTAASTNFAQRDTGASPSSSAAESALTGPGALRGERCNAAAALSRRAAPVAAMRGAASAAGGAAAAADAGGGEACESRDARGGGWVARLPPENKELTETELVIPLAPRPPGGTGSLRPPEGPVATAGDPFLGLTGFTPPAVTTVWLVLRVTTCRCGCGDPAAREMEAAMAAVAATAALACEAAALDDDPPGEAPAGQLPLPHGARFLRRGLIQDAAPAACGLLPPASAPPRLFLDDRAETMMPLMVSDDCGCCGDACELALMLLPLVMVATALPEHGGGDGDRNVAGPEQKRCMSGLGERPAICWMATVGMYPDPTTATWAAGGPEGAGADAPIPRRGDNKRPRAPAACCGAVPGGAPKLAPEMAAMLARRGIAPLARGGEWLFDGALWGTSAKVGPDAEGLEARAATGQPPAQATWCGCDGRCGAGAAWPGPGAKIGV